MTLSPVYNRFASIYPDDAADLPDRSLVAIYVGGLGDVSVTGADNANAALFRAVPAGTILPVTCRRVNASLTTATDLVALYLA